MTITLSLIDYPEIHQPLFIKTSDGQKLYLSKGDSFFPNVKLTTQKDTIEYQFGFEVNGNEILEWRKKKISISKLENTDFIVYDYWSKANFPENYFGTKAFRFYQPKPTSNTEYNFSACTHLFRLHAFTPKPNYAFGILGNHEKLGNWDTNHPMALNCVAEGVWEVAVDFSDVFTSLLEFKFVLIDRSTGKFISYESGENRRVPNQKGKFQLVNCGYYRFLKENLFRGTGVAIPVFSLRTKQSFGVGEFYDLIPFANWAEQVGFNLIQILPINDTTVNYSWTDSYPYSAISIFALHPLYLNLERYLTDDLMKKNYSDLRDKLNQKSSVDYERVIQEKWNFIRAIFQSKIFEHIKEKKFQQFLKENEHWLYAYALFCYLRDIYKSADFSEWKSEHQSPPKDIQAEFQGAAKKQQELWLHAWVQYLLFSQLSKVKKHLEKKKIALKGDLPIGISRKSVEAWYQPEYFHMEFQAGAPPDDFSVLGQNWEFPTYNWQRMQQDQFSWWKKRFQFMDKFFDAFRIDHILGFFRIWQIPRHATQGLLGFFHPALPVTREELYHRGIHFDEELFCKPFVLKNRIFHEIQETDAPKVWDLIFEDLPNGFGKFKPEFSSQRKIEEQAKRNVLVATYKDYLLHLHTEVIFVKESENAYHPRFNLFHTRLYHQLPNDQKEKLYHLHTDYFYHRQEEFWRQKGMEKLPELVRSTNMLTCGEDLGLVPACVPKVMDELAILSLQIQRMPPDDRPFTNPFYAPYLCVVTPSTHDTSTLRMWWEENPEITRRYYYEQLGLQGECPKFLTPEVAYKIIEQHIQSPAMWAIFPLQDIFALDENYYVDDMNTERINIPSVFPHYWNYRMQVEIERLLADDKFCKRISQLNSLRK